MSEDFDPPLAIPQPPHPGFWWSALWCLGLIVFLRVVPGILALGIFVVEGMSNPKLLRMARDEMTRSPEFARPMLIAMAFAQVLSAGSAWLVLRLFAGREWHRLVALRRPSAAHLVLALIGLPALITVNIGVDGLARRFLPDLGALDRAIAMFAHWPILPGILVIGLGPGIGEELWCRAFLGRGLVARYGALGGVVLTSLLFGLLHLDPRHVAIAMFIGIFLHLTYLATRSLVVPMILHIGNNTLSILSMHYSSLEFTNARAGDIPWLVYAAAIALMAVVGWTLFQSRARYADRPASIAPPWRPLFPGVEYPPPQSATYVAHPGSSKLAWMLTIVAFAVFVAAVVPAAMELNSRPALDPEEMIEPD